MFSMINALKGFKIMNKSSNGFSMNKVQPRFMASFTNVNYPGRNGLELPGYYKTKEGSKMGLIVLQEWWGLNDQMKSYVEKYNTDGKFNALCPDLFRGVVATNQEHASQLLSQLDWEGAIEDIRLSAQYLLANGNAKVGVVGFCMGGALSLAAASLLKEIAVCVSFYGIPNYQFADPINIHCPVQCHFGNLDDHADFSDPAAANKLEERLKEGKVKYEIYRYDGAKHAFTNKSRPEVYNEEAAKLALQRSISILQINLAK